MLWTGRGCCGAEGLVLAMCGRMRNFVGTPIHRRPLKNAADHSGEDWRDDPVPLKVSDNLPLAGVPRIGNGSRDRGAGMGRDMALYGADVLNIWRPRDSEIEAFAWDVRWACVQRSSMMRRKIEKKFNQLLKDADVFFAQ